MAALLADENLPSLVSSELMRLGHDVLTMLQAGLAGQAIPDHEVIRRASSFARSTKISPHLPIEFIRQLLNKQSWRINYCAFRSPICRHD
jgi:hypothetical protein